MVLAMGTLVQAMGAKQSGDAQEKQSRYNRLMALRNAREAREKGLKDESIFRTQATRSLGDMRASYAASGVNFEGSALDVYAESVANVERDALEIKHGSELRARAYESDAYLEGEQGRNARRAGQFGMLSAVMGGVSQYAAGMKHPTKKRPSIEKVLKSEDVAIYPRRNA